MPHNIAIFLFGGALAIRLVALWILPDLPLSTNATIAYLGGAQLILEGKGFADPSYPVFSPPLYAIILAALQALFGDPQLPVKLAQVFVDSLTVVLVYRIAGEAFDERAAIWAAAGWAMYPFAIYPTLYIGVETLFTFLLALFVFLTIRVINAGRHRDYLAAGMVLGLATMVRGTSQFLPILFLLLVVVLRSERHGRIGKYLVFIASFTIVLLPWGLRNYAVLDEMIPVAAARANVLYGSSEKLWKIESRESGFQEVLDELRRQGLIGAPGENSSPSDTERYLYAAGIANYKNLLLQRPVEFLGLMSRKAVHLWYATESGKNERVIVFVNIPIYLLAFAGGVIALHARRRLSLLPFGLVGYFFAMHMAVHPLFRFMIPVMPYVITFAAVAVDRLHQQMTVRTKREGY